MGAANGGEYRAHLPGHRWLPIHLIGFLPLLIGGTWFGI
jgi:hypothetical protein